MIDRGASAPHVEEKGDPGLSDAGTALSRDVTIANKEGLHARPVMRFVDVASTFGASVRVANVSGRNQWVDGKSAMEMMLLEAVQGSVLRIEATGAEAQQAIDALSSLVEAGFADEPSTGANTS